MITGAETDAPFAWITPFLPLLGVIFGGLIVGAFAVYNRRKGNMETKVPTVQALWEKQVQQGEQLDAEIAKRRILEDKVTEQDRQIVQLTRGREVVVEAFEGLRETFKKFAARVQGGGSANLTKAEKAALELPIASDEDWPTVTTSQLHELRETGGTPA